jgi:hypothetical protein
MTTFRAMATVAVFSIASVSTALPAGPKVSTKAPKVSVQAPKSSVKAPKVSTAPKSGKAQVSTKKATTTTASTKKATATTASTTSTTTPTTTTPTTTTPTTPETGTTPAPPNAVSTKISGNPEQLARVQGMLPQGVTLEQATAGFRNQGQFIAALNASKSQGVNFVDLQKAMTVDGLSLGQAVKKVKATPPPAPTTPPPGGTL